jgi:radical SAM superfamily enzyme YgiQ (UPF0313 family)
MDNNRVVFVTLNQVDNLGIGYLSAALSENGYEPFIIDIQNGREEIPKILKRLKPKVVGFSIIFQYHILEFKKLINYLRNEGIDCHFTAGGYYASLRYKKLFEIIPALDSIVRFEGEYTLIELVNCICSGTDWRYIKGIALNKDNKIIANPLRQVETDLDKLPLPFRSLLKVYAFGKRTATLVAGRGCVNNCSFCNTREYFKQSSGPIKRLRKPEKVVSEMELLFNKDDCSVFLFEDDDFPVKTSKGSDWITEFCEELVRKNLKDKIMWKINCRPDEIDYATFLMMKKHGLYLVFLGLDDGTDTGLARLNKQMTVRKSLEGIKILKRLEIGFDYGFMLFQPSSTYDSINDNLDFLRQICGVGYTSVTFLKLMPYFDTRIEEELRKEGRIKGRLGFLNYDFLDESLNSYYEFVTTCLMKWIRDIDGLVNISKWAKIYISVFTHYYKITPEASEIFHEIKKNVAESNQLILDIMKELAVLFESGKYNKSNYNELENYKKTIRTTHGKYIKQIKNCINELIRIAEYQEVYQIINY